MLNTLGDQCLSFIQDCVKIGLRYSKKENCQLKMRKEQEEMFISENIEAVHDIIRVLSKRPIKLQDL